MLLPLCPVRRERDTAFKHRARSTSGSGKYKRVPVGCLGIKKKKKKTFYLYNHFKHLVGGGPQPSPPICT